MFKNCILYLLLVFCVTQTILLHDCVSCGIHVATFANCHSENSNCNDEPICECDTNKHYCSDIEQYIFNHNITNFLLPEKVYSFYKIDVHICSFCIKEQIKYAPISISLLTGVFLT